MCDIGIQEVAPVLPFTIPCVGVNHIFIQQH